MVKKMFYKLISEWRSPNGIEHEITVYKYNLSHDEMVRYFKTADSLTIKTFPIDTPSKETYYDLEGN